MPQHAKGPRLYRRKDTQIYIIRDTGRGEKSTGTRDSKEAERQLAIYIANKNRPCDLTTSDEMTIAQALDIYATEHAPSVADPARIAYAIEALVPYWGELPVSSISRKNCLAYGRSRQKVTKRDPMTDEVLETRPVARGTVRKELGTLSAAINYCLDEKYLKSAPKIHLPQKSEPKDRWLTRSEAAQLLWAAWRNPKSKHLARFILIALYTGTRKTAILKLRYEPCSNAGWVDLEFNRMYRRGHGEVDSKKRRTPIRLPRQLSAHLRRWKRDECRWVVNFEGSGVGSIKSTWKTAIENAGLAGTGVTPHTLRHTAITWAMQAEADIWQTAGYFGVSTETMFKVYAHHHPDHQKSTVQAMEKRGRNCETT
ncbi:integrase [Ruegeria arenilitoris]|uniref:integrase n=1 Tax=Ruegeria arenilitoris TaxID=1173585 RepID=UPI00147C39BE|nr:site-specific integrase [Ruegeria arenilitoris]